MKKNNKQKSINSKPAKKSALPREIAKMMPTLRNSFFVFLGMIFGIIITSAIVGTNMKSEGSKLNHPVVLSENNNSPQKNPSVAKISFPADILNVSGSVEAVSKSEIIIKTSSCQGEKKYTGKITKKTVISRRERQGNYPSSEENEANISEIKKNDQVVLESYEDISKAITFEVKRVIIEKSFASQ